MFAISNSVFERAAREQLVFPLVDNQFLARRKIFACSGFMGSRCNGNSLFVHGDGMLDLLMLGGRGGGICNIIHSQLLMASMPDLSELP